ncbi:MAG: hypothetical protein K8R54_18970 [Bacteroidales bacterium]|nr:hypothetical protein [Bacteroidales bacterium]
MRFFLFIFPFVLLISSCNEENKAQNSSLKDSVSISDTKLVLEINDNKSVIDSSEIGLQFSPTDSYANSKSKISSRRLQYYNELTTIKDDLKRDSIINDASKYFTKALLNQIVPHWYGTVWDFNGYTNKPNDGVIACGYFVSTTLKHTGLNINRYKLAQQGGMNEAETLESKDDLLIYRLGYASELESVFTKMKNKLKDGLYFVGLSCHVGYIYVKNNELYFLHSNYIDGYVMVEKAEYSEAFKSNIYVIADITFNSSLIAKWIDSSVVQVVTD